MDIVARYRAYADAFEETYLDDDWSRLAPFFTENACYSPGQQSASGRDATLDLLKRGIDGFDRRMDSREVEFFNHTAQGNEVHVDWRATYRKSGLPELSFGAREIAVFEGDRIAELREVWEPAVEAQLQAWMMEHADKLQDNG